MMGIIRIHQRTILTVLAFIPLLSGLVASPSNIRPHLEPPNLVIPPADSSPTPTSSADPDICFTPECVKAAARLMEAMDTAIDPCDDFFQYACGSWNRKHVIPEDLPRYNTFIKLQSDIYVTLKNLLEEPVASNDISAIKKAKHLYESCRNTSIIEKRRDTPLRELLGSLGGWPVLDENFEDESSDVTTLMANMRLIGQRKVLISVNVGPDDKDSEVNVIRIDQAGLGIPSRDYYLGDRHDPTLVSYQTFAADVAKLMQADPERADREMEEMVNFEIRLANITTPGEQRRDKESMYNEVELSELSKLTQEIDWARYMEIIFDNVSVQINKRQAVMVYEKDYLKRLGHLLSDTPKRQVVNYLMWRTVMNHVEYLSQEFIDARLHFDRALSGKEKEATRWTKCVTFVIRSFDMALGRMFVQEHFDENAKANAMHMILKIKDAFNKLLEEVSWLDDTTRQAARKKAINIKEQIGYPDYITNDTVLNDDWNQTNIITDRFFDNMLAIQRAITRTKLQTIVKPVDHSRWFSSPAVVTAYYHRSSNQITFPAAILQPPFYYGSHPKSMNYGGIGTVVGHEITHGFDDEGRQYDKDGNLKQWWSDRVIDRFNARAQCIVDQYSNYTVPQVNMTLNGVRTQGENIADNGGLKQAFKAYRTWVDEQGHEEKALPGLNFTHNQLFFLNFAQIWCGTARQQDYVQYILSWRHSPREFRVMGSLSNSYEFRDAFNCPSGSRMNPGDKCSVW